FHGRDRFVRAEVEREVQHIFGAEDEVSGDGLTVDVAETFVYNEAQVTRDGGDTQRADDQASVDAYGPRTRTLDGLGLRDDRQARQLAEWTVFRYAEPQARATAWSVMPELDAASWEEVLALEVGHRVALEVVPAGVGDPLGLEL